MIKLKKLSNGLKIFYLGQLGSPKRIYLTLFIKCGSLFEKKLEFGFSHLIEHLLINRRYDNFNNLSDFLKFIDVDYEAFVGKEYSSFLFDLPVKVLDKFNNFLQEFFSFNPSSNKLKIEKRVVVEETELMLEKNQKEIFYSIRDREIFGNHPLSNNFYGKKKSIQQATIKKIIDFFYRHYQPENIVFGLIGDWKAVDKFLNNLQKINFVNAGLKKIIKFPTVRSISKKRIIEVRNKNFNQSHFIYTFLYRDLLKKDYILMPLIQLLIEKELFRKLREEFGLVYHIESNFYTYASCLISILDFYTSCQVTKTKEVLKLIPAIIKNFNFNEKNFYQTKKILIDSITADPFDLLEYYSGWLLYNRSVFDPEQTQRLIEKIKFQEFRRYFQEKIIKHRESLILVGKPS